MVEGSARASEEGDGVPPWAWPSERPTVGASSIGLAPRPCVTFCFTALDLAGLLDPPMSVCAINYPLNHSALRPAEFRSSPLGAWRWRELWAP